MADTLVEASAMLRKTLFLMLSLSLFPALVLADLTGTWKADDGGTYYLREMNGMVHWYGEESSRNPRWANVFHGKIRRGRISGMWMDVPKGRTMGNGQLELRIRDNGNELIAVRKTGGFGGSRWTRLDQGRADERPIRHETREAAPHRLAAPVPGAMQRSAQEDCIAFNPRNVDVRQVNGSWKIVEGNHWMFDFGNKRDEARTAYRIIRHYNTDKSCFVGRPNPSFTYMLSANRAPSGAMRGEDCIAFNPRHIVVKRINGSWKIVEGSHWMFDFGNKRDEAEQSAAIIRKYGFTQACYVGRPHPSFKYLRR